MALAKVCLGPGQKCCLLDSGSVELKPDDRVVLQNESGLRLGRVKVVFGDADPQLCPGQIKTLVRLATPEDLAQEHKNQALEMRALEFCQHRILIAYESIRNGLYGASHVFRPGKDWIQRAESKIQALSTLRENGKPAPAMKDPRPDVGWSVVVVLGLLGWIGSLLGYARWVLGKEKRSGGRMPRAALWIGLAILFFALWILGMVFA